MEALLIPENVCDHINIDCDCYDSTLINLTKHLTHFHHLIIDWRFTDDIVIYETDYNISYSILKDYKQLNFVTYNKEAHLIFGEMGEKIRKILASE